MPESDDVKGTIDFYTQALGFSLEAQGEDEEGTYWCRLKRDSAEIMFTNRNVHSKEVKATFNGVLYFYPDHVDELYEELKSKVRVEWEPQDFGYGMYDFAIRDNNNFILAFGQPLSELNETS